jgi:hypothetical protein
MTISKLAERAHAAKLFDEWQKALMAWRDCPDQLQYDGGGIVRCAASGEPVLESDEIVTDQETGDIFIREAIGLPPRGIRAEPNDYLSPRGISQRIRKKFAASAEMGEEVE